MTTVGVMGAGAIGCYLGGRLVEHGTDVVLVGRESLAKEIAEHGMRLSDYRGRDARLAPERVAVHTSARSLDRCDVVLVTVKGLDTERTARELDPILSREAIVVSFQNGVSNADVLRTGLGGRTVLAGMVPFNVLRSAGAHFHQGTSGRLAIERAERAEPLVEALGRAGLEIRAHADMRGVLWGKLLVNLNNSVNALAGVPIKTMLQDRGYRRVMAACVEEAFGAVRAAGIRPKLDVPLPPRILPSLLRLPDAVFSILARPMIHVDPQARSSMWDDLERGRKTEIDSLNGEIVRLGERLSRPTPVNSAIVRLVRETEGARSPGLSAVELARRLGISPRG
jgi:2-dehydropantoate 2-reductase